MFGLPEWAVGVGAVLVLVTVLQVIYVRRLAELDEVKQRLGELEERVDFAERLLAKQREAERLGPS